MQVLIEDDNEVNWNVFSTKTTTAFNIAKKETETPSELKNVFSTHWLHGVIISQETFPSFEEVSPLPKFAKLRSQIRRFQTLKAHMT